MVMIPPRPAQEVINRIYSSYKREDELYLGRLGSSFIGEECIRKTWFDWRGFARESFSGRILRLFETGHLQEARVVADLKAAGFEVWEKNSDGDQFSFGDETGHFVTKMDGVIRGIPEDETVAYALEIKTHNKNSFSAIQKHGVEKSKPEHYAQVQITMDKANLDKTLYVAVCKDDEQYYIEVIKADKPEQKKLNTKIVKLVEARMRPAGISDDATSFGCKFCGMKEVCTGDAQPLQHCRTCSNCTPEVPGEWYCNLHECKISLDKQKTGCNDWNPL